MGEISGCLKRLFVKINSVFLAFGLLMIYGAVKSSIYYSHMPLHGLGLAWGLVFAIGIILISGLGIYAGLSEKELVLKIFACIMVAGMIIMLIFGIMAVVSRNQVKNDLTSASTEYSKSLMDDEEFRTMLDRIQRSVECCGVVSASDWGDKIPWSCLCWLYRSGCISKPQGVEGRYKIYSKTCGGYIFQTVDTVFKVAMGICFGFAAAALLVLLMSLLMIYQLSGHGCCIRCF